MNDVVEENVKDQSQIQLEVLIKADIVQIKMMYISNMTLMHL